MTKAAPAIHPRQRCRMASCPHVRRQRNFMHVFLALTVANVVIRHTLWSDDTAPGKVVMVGFAIAVTVLVVAMALPPLRGWFGWGQHSPQPDEREALVAAYAKAQIHDLMMLSMPFVLLALMLGFPGQRALAYGVIGMYLALIAGGWFFTRRLNARM